MEAGLYRPHDRKFGRYPPTLPVRSQLGREGLGAQTLPLQPPRWTVCTKSGHRPLLPSLRVGQPGPLRQLASCLCLRRPISHPSWRWVGSHLDQRWVGFCPDTFQRLQLLRSQFGWTYVDEVIRLVGLWVRQAPVALGGMGRHGAGPTVTVSNGSSRRALPIP